MDTSKTVGGSIVPADPLIMKQKEDVARMRASLLCCSDDPHSASVAMKNITVLRVYHQISRIIKYLEMMDKIEAKLYESIDSTLDRIDPTNTTTWMVLLNLQERLQNNLINSHKLLQPYLNVQEFNLEDLAPTVTTSPTGDGTSILSRESRDKLRSSAQQVLAILGPMEDDENANDVVG